MAKKAKLKFKSEDWISSIEAVHLLRPHLGTDKKAKAAIAERLRDCSLRATAVWMSFGPDVGLITVQRDVLISETATHESFERRSLPNTELAALAIAHGMPANMKVKVHEAKSDKQPIHIGGAFWNFSEDWKRDQKRWDWFSGAFLTAAPYVVRKSTKQATTDSSVLMCRNVAYGVKFNRADILKIVEPSKNTQQPKVETFESESKRGRKKDATKWALWMVELFRLERSGGITLDMTANRLNETIASNLASKMQQPPARSTTEHVSKLIIELLQAERIK